MRILVIGSGGREHAICHAFAKSSKVTSIFCANGNAGISNIATLVDLKPDQINELADFAVSQDIDLTFVGGETSLALGIVDEFESRGLRIIGVSKAAARLESSKSFAKDFMLRNAIPTAKYKTAFSTSEAISILQSGEFGDESMPVVVKADGLAAGKGVVVASDRKEAIDAINDLEALVGKAASATIVLEECLFGREVSLILFCDGDSFALMPPTRDHKRIGEGDTGPNTGGMGTITDDGLLSDEQMQEIIETVIMPSIRGCADEGFPFKGIMFLGLMMTDDGTRVLEYNVRFGDPETQAILVRLESDFTEICEAMIEGRLNETVIKWSSGNSACIILASEGYPTKPRVGDVVNGLDNASDQSDVIVFHAGTRLDEQGKNVLTSGGRVLGVTAVADNLSDALSKAYDAVSLIDFDGMQYRRDIGK